MQPGTDTLILEGEQLVKKLEAFVEKFNQLEAKNISGLKFQVPAFQPPKDKQATGEPKIPQTPAAVEAKEFQTLEENFKAKKAYYLAALQEKLRLVKNTALEVRLNPEDFSAKRDLATLHFDFLKIAADFREDLYLANLQYIANRAGKNDSDSLLELLANFNNDLEDCMGIHKQSPTTVEDLRLVIYDSLQNAVVKWHNETYQREENPPVLPTFDVRQRLDPNDLIKRGETFRGVWANGQYEDYNLPVIKGHRNDPNDLLMKNTMVELRDFDAAQSAPGHEIRVQLTKLERELAKTQPTPAPSASASDVKDAPAPQPAPQPATAEAKAKRKAAAQQLGSAGEEPIARRPEAPLVPASQALGPGSPLRAATPKPLRPRPATPVKTGITPLEVEEPPAPGSGKTVTIPKP